ncbi:chorismate mutase [Kribbella sp. NPDC026611]|uniref:chorismate mutase n=1 Tax=Kribbella sp. NPDC026611 TaxID=3154911 RepID=UPI0033C3DF44
MAVRAIRGATQLDVDEREHLLDRTAELVRAVLEANELENEDLISILFTVTSDLRSEFPAVAGRQIGLTDVPLMCMQEIPVPHALPRVVRLMVHTESSRSRDKIQHVYLHGATALRPDLTGAQ